MNGEVKETEISLACTLIDNMSASFAPELYHDDYRARLEEAIQNKINGQEIVEQPPDFRFTNVIDLMDALKRSIAVTEQRKAEQPKSQSKPKPKVKATTALTGIAPELANAMNRFVIAVGVSYLPLHEEALRTAQAMGDVPLAGNAKESLPSAYKAIEQAKEKGRLGFKRKAVRC